MHLDLDYSVAGTGFTAPTLYIEAESAGIIASELCIRSMSEHIPYQIENPGVGCGIASWSPADGRLIDLDDLVYALHAGQTPETPRHGLGMIEPPHQLALQGFVDERGFAAARDACHHRERTERDMDGHVLEVVLAAAAD